jgi:uncharacterized protein YbjT (DUF2867 family)
MRVLVTGGTGFVGSHTVAALVERGHEVRLLVRAVQRVAPALAPLGLQAADLDTVVGDVTDPAAVEQAVRGCETVVHAASVYAFDSRDAPSSVGVPRSPPRAAIQSRTCATWQRCTPRSWSPAAGPAATWPAAPSCASPTSWRGWGR